MQITRTQKNFVKILNAQSDILLLAELYKNFWKMCLEIYGLDPARFLSAPGHLWEAVLKNTKVKLELLTDIDMLLMVEKAIRGAV